MRGFLSTAAARLHPAGLHLGVIHVGSPLANTYDCLNRSSGGATGLAWPAANRALFVPFSVPAPVIAKKLWWFNGATVTGSVDMGIYDLAGVRLVSTGATGQSGSSAVQIADITDTALQPGVYYLAMAMDSTSTAVRYSTASTQWMQACGMKQMASAYTLPDPVTYADIATNYLPLMGVQLRTVL